jgi:hypothetical protein
MAKRELPLSVVAVAFGATLAMGAQLTSTSQYAPPKNDGKQIVAIGCIHRPAKNSGPSGQASFTIEDFRGPTYRLDGDPNMLAFQVGHEVELRGPIVEAETKTTDAKVKYESLVYLSATCRK